MAASRITNKDIKLALGRLNGALGRSLEPWSKNGEGVYRSNIGNFHEYSAYGMVGLHEMVSEGGAVRSHGGLGTKRELYERIHAMLDGVELAGE